MPFGIILPDCRDAAVADDYHADGPGESQPAAFRRSASEMVPDKRATQGIV